jgi:hypothetical protein
LINSIEHRWRQSEAHDGESSNINATIEHATKLSRVKSPMEFFALSNEYAKRQFETLMRQAQELGAIVQQMTATTSRDR